MKSIYYILLLSFPLWSSSVKTVTHSSRSDFERGETHNVTILHDGVLTPAPTLELVLDTGDPYIWTLAEDSQGNTYIGSGNEAKIYKVLKNGDSTLIFDAEELAVFAMAIDADDVLYAATSPNGKVYKIKSQDQITPFFDPPETYIWDLQLTADNNLLVATGDEASIYHITSRGDSKKLFQENVSHVRSLAVADDGTIYAGTSGKGYVYRIADENPFVLFDPQMEEVNGLIVRPDGSVTASVFGEMISPTSTQRVVQQTNNRNADSNNSSEEEEAALASQMIALENLKRPQKTPMSLFLISPDGYAKDLWIGSDEEIQAIAPYTDDDILVGSGSSGKVLQVDRQGNVSILLDSDESHVTALLKSEKDHVLVGASNMGKCYRVVPGRADSAIFVSEPIDADVPAVWGTMKIEGNEHSSFVTLYTRSGNTEQPSSSWSDWQTVVSENDILRIKSPTARFVQWKCEFADERTKIDEISLSYRQKNIAPEISSIIIHRPGDYYETQNNTGDKETGVNFPIPLTNKQRKRGYQTVDWLFEDANYDALVFSVFYLRNGSSQWRELATDLNVNFYSWDSEQMADGEYRIKVAASDKPSNTANEALTHENKSRPFVVDNSPPLVRWQSRKNQNSIRFRVQDDWHTLSTVEYSLDAGDWESIHPQDGLLDSKGEEFEIKLPDEGTHDIAVKATDKVGNTSVNHFVE